jgi:hypothetical protein
VYFTPPYVLLLAGFLAAITSGYAFSISLQESVSEWNANRSSRILVKMRGMQLKVPFLGICGGVCVFLASGIQLFGFPGKFAYSLSLPMTILIALLVWSQLSKILQQLEQGGSKAIDLDAF